METLKEQIEKAIKGHLVIANPQSIHYSVDKIIDIIEKLKP